jgi:hypothetical protein
MLRGLTSELAEWHVPCFDKDDLRRRAEYCRSAELWSEENDVGRRLMGRL